MKRSVSTLAFLSVIATSSLAAAQVPEVSATAGSPQSAQGPSLWFVLPEFGDGIGVGGRYMIPLPSIPSLLKHATIRDAFALEFGADYFHYSYDYNFPGLDNWSVNWLAAFGGIMWNVWFNDQFAIYPKFEIGFGKAWVSGWDDRFGSATSTDIFWNGAAGVLYRLKDSNLTLRAELGSHALRAGVAWLF